jgi:hypothetical protein
MAKPASKRHASSAAAALHRRLALGRGACMPLICVFAASKKQEQCAYSQVTSVSIGMLQSTDQ